MNWDIKDLDNKKVGSVDLNDQVFSAAPRPDIIHRMVRWQLAKARSGNHQTKEIWAVRGTTKKPFAQKGTGRARAGSLRAPQMRGGAVIFGPHKRDHSFDLPKKVRKLALRSILASKAAEGSLVIVDAFELKNPKAKELNSILQKNGWNSPLFIGGTELNENFCKASRNLVNVNVLPQQGANVYSIMKCKTLVLSKDALHHLEARLV
jgi:large subunit ribosomal protein L4